MIAIFSDLHADLEAARATVELAHTRGAGELICLGDVVGYGDQPDKTIDFLRGAGVTCLMGNHDEALALGGRAFSELRRPLQEVVTQHRAALCEDNLDWLRSRPTSLRKGDLLFTHAPVPRPELYRYPTLSRNDATAAPTVFVHLWEVGEELRRLDVRGLFTGHTHVPMVTWFLGWKRCRSRHPSRPSYRLPAPPQRMVVNVGSATIPRTSRGRRSLVLVEEATGELQFVRF